jgi:broad specificity phosphatase PhoE
MRAHDLARRLAEAGVDAIYASQFKRTILTGEPLAKQLGIDVRIAPINGAAEEYAVSLARTILAEHRGQTVLVVNHSNTVPLIARAHY